MDTGRAAKNEWSEFGLLHEGQLHLPLDRVSHTEKTVTCFHLQTLAVFVPVENACLNRVAVVDLGGNGYRSVRTEGVNGARRRRCLRSVLGVANLRRLCCLWDE